MTTAGKKVGVVVSKRTISALDIVLYVSVTVCFLLQEPSDDLDDLNFFNQKKKKKKTKKVFENEIEEGIKVSHVPFFSLVSGFCHLLCRHLVPHLTFCPTKLGHEN